VQGHRAKPHPACLGDRAARQCRQRANLLMLSADRVYVMGHDGAALVLKRGPTFEMFASNAVDDGCDSSPAVVNGELHLNGLSTPLPHREPVTSGRIPP